MKKSIFFFVLVFGLNLNAQESAFSTDINIVGVASSEDVTPFWIHSNKRGRLDAETNFSAWTNSEYKYNLSENSFLRAGVGLLYHDGFNDEINLDQSYLQYQNQWFDVVVGRKQRPELYNGLSATNESILWSLNARPLPGLQLRTTKPIMVFKDEGISFEAELEEYWMGNDRLVRGTRLHHKSFHVTFNPIESFNLKVGVRHFAQWAGTSPDYGKLPSGIKDYVNVFTAQGGDEDAEEGDQLNALGNHLGSYELVFTTQLNGHNIQLIYNHLFEDGSGRRFGNTPDGRYGIFFENKNPDRLIGSFMYELFYTKHQSHTSTGTDGTDNYFQNQVYASGWTYENFILGVPFILSQRDEPVIINNKVLVHHFGFGGNIINDHPYQLLLSYRKNYGAKGVSNYKYDVLSSYFNVQVYDKWINAKVFVGSDISTDSSPVWGAGLHLQKQLF